MQLILRLHPTLKVTTDNSKVTPKFNRESEFQDSGLSLNRHLFNWVSGLNALTLNQKWVNIITIILNSMTQVTLLLQTLKEDYCMVYR